MADVAISYSHDDAALAVALRTRLENGGLAVWMDDSGIPIGARHWDVIEQEFADAEVIVVVDTPAWASKDYCQREAELCRDLGKWMVFWREERDAAVLAEIAHARVADKQELAAHARMASRAIAEDQPISNLQRALFRRRANDAQRLLGSELVRTELTPRIRATAERQLRESEAVRRRVRQGGIGVLAALSVLAIGGLVGALLASGFAASAAESSRNARAAALIVNSQNDVDTLRAIASAQEALTLRPNDRSRAAVVAAELRDRRMRSIELSPAEYVGGAWAPDSPTVVVYSRERVLAIDTETGTTGTPIPVDVEIVPNMLVAGPGGSTAVFVNGSGALTRVDLGTGVTTLLGPVHVRAVALGTDGTLAWSTSDSMLHTAVYPCAGPLEETAGVTLLAIARAIDIDGDGGRVALVDEQGWLRVYDDSTLDELSSVRVSHSGPLSGTGGFRATVTICGDRFYGSFTPGVLGIFFSTVDGVSTSVRAVERTAAVCTVDDALSASLARGDPKYASDDSTTMVVPEDLTRFLSVRDPQHVRISYLSATPSRLIIATDETAITRVESGVITAVVPLTNRLLGTTDSGAVVEIATGETVGTLSGAALTSDIAVLGCDAILIDQVNVSHLDCDGDITAIMSSEGIRGARAGADGAHFVICFEDRVTLVAVDGRTTSELDFDWLDRLAVLNDADLSPDGSTVALSDVLGRVHTVPVDDPSNPSTADESGPAGNVNHISYLPGGDILALGPDGVGRRYNTSLDVIDARQLGTQPTSLLVSGDRVYAAALETRIFDTKTLTLVEEIATADLIPNPLSPNADVWGVLRAGIGTEEYAGYLIRVPALT